MHKAASDMQSAVDSELTRTADELNRAAAGTPPESAPAAEPAKVEPPKPQEPKQA